MITISRETALLALEMLRRENDQNYHSYMAAERELSEALQAAPDNGSPCLYCGGLVKFRDRDATELTPSWHASAPHGPARGVG